MSEQVIIRPQTGPQEAFLSSSADIVIYGGAAGGGKTWGLLLEPLRHVANSGFGAVIFRRTSPQITNEGGLWDESMGLYPLVGATPKRHSLDWEFPSGANIGFRHLQHEADKLSWMGAQVAFLGWDELTHFSRSQFFYLLSRNRSMCGMKPYVRCTCNPDPESWVAQFIKWWIGEDGYPIPARSGVVRWFVAVGNEIVWDDTPEGLRVQYPDLHPKSVTFIPASVHDNKKLLEANPGYLANLMALPRVERERLLGGNWKVRAEGLVFGELLDHIVEPQEIKGVHRILFGQDWGWHNPAATLAGVLDDRDTLWITNEIYSSGLTLDGPTVGLTDELRRRDLVCLALDLAEELKRRYGMGVDLVWADPAEPRSIEKFRRAGLRTAGAENSILTGIAVVNTRIRAGRLKVFRSCVNFIRELGLYRHPTPEEVKLVGEKPIDANNHACSALRYMVHELDRIRERERPPEPTEKAKVELPPQTRYRAIENAPPPSDREQIELANTDHLEQCGWESM